MTYDEPSEETEELMASAKALLTGVSDAELIITLHRVLKDFFNYSNAWMENIGVVAVPNTLDYPIKPITGEIIRLVNVIDQNNVPQAAVLLQNLDILHLLYPYNTTQSLTVVVAKNVKHPYREGKPFPPYVPKEIYRNYGIGILDGLVGRLMIQAGQSWSSPQEGLVYLGAFSRTIDLARVSARQMNVLGGQAWAFPQQFRVSGQKAGVSTFNMNPSPITAR